MPPRYSSPYASSYSFGPGPLSSAMKALIGANVVMFFAQFFMPSHHAGARPAARVGHRASGGLAARHLHVPARRAVPHPVQHARAVDVRHRARAHLGHALLPEVLLRDRHRRRRPDRAVLAAAVRRRAAAPRRRSSIGASGAIYGLLLAYALYFPDRPIYLYLVRSRSRRSTSCMIMGAIAFYASLAARRRRRERDAPRRPASVGYLYLEGRAHRTRCRSEVPLPEVEDQPRAARSSTSTQAAAPNDWNRRVTQALKRHRLQRRDPRRHRRVRREQVRPDAFSEVRSGGRADRRCTDAPSRA